MAALLETPDGMMAGESGGCSRRGSRFLSGPAGGTTEEERVGSAFDDRAAEGGGD